MIWQVIEIHLRRLRHNRIEWLLTFVVPIAFFTIFALIFTRGVGSTPRVKIVLVNESIAPNQLASNAGAPDSAPEKTVSPSEHAGQHTPEPGIPTATAPNATSRILDQLRASEGLKIIRGAKEGDTVDRSTAETMVRRGTATIAVVLKETDGTVSAELLNDASDQVASQVVTALLSRAMMITAAKSAAPFGSATPFKPADARNPKGDSAANHPSAPTSPPEPTTDVGAESEFASFIEQVAKKNALPSATNAASNSTPSSGSTPAKIPALGPPQIEVVNLIGQDKSNPVVSVYAAGIAVMFLLFGATSGGGVLLEERENQTLERLLATQMTMDHLLLGKWFYLTLLGCVQVTVMFVWAQLVFGLDLLHHLDGFAIMTVATSAAAASFGLFLATLCSSRGQLNGLSVVAVLSMSALGGSMVPRYVMSESLQEAGLWTFNAWALDGYDKVFWRGLPPSELGPQLTVLLGTAFALLVLARLLAIRWERV
ncbi:ABC transporter permease [Neorhodopirellula lusitana]|uniref:ABC transporter permease n=1 Tax=Neorhodopirellula lusitana TaxID=445327 RepID=UPI00384D2A2A